MAQQFLQAAQIGARAEQMRRKTVPQGMRRCTVGQAERATCARGRLLHHALRQRSALRAAEQRFVARRDKPAYAVARRLDWGDAI